MIETARFLDQATAEKVQREFGTPTYVYSEALMRAAAHEVLALPAPFGLTVRYAMKANPNRRVLQLFTEEGVEIDASSGYEAERAMKAGIPGNKIMLTAQELPGNLRELVEAGVFYNACSLRQIETYGRLFPGTEMAVRINPGVGEGGHVKTSVAGEEKGFAIWHEQIPEVKALVQCYGLTVRTVHTHVGSGTDPELWQQVAEPCAALLHQFPEATRLSLGGGFKVGRMQGEKTADFQAIGARIKQVLQDLERATGRRIHLEVEPGTFLVANAGTLLARVQDITRTRLWRFLKLDAGMTEILRPALYRAQHPIVVLNDSPETAEYVVVGHCCESGDTLTPDPEDSDKEKPRQMKKAQVGDLVAIEGAGAYCASMSAINYNSFPQAAEVFVTADGELRLVRRRETLDQVLENEL